MLWKLSAEVCDDALDVQPISDSALFKAGTWREPRGLAGEKGAVQVQAGTVLLCGGDLTLAGTIF